MDKTLLVANVKRYTARYMPKKLATGTCVTSVMAEAHFDTAVCDARGNAIGVLGTGGRLIAVFADIGTWGLTSAISGVKAAYEADMLPRNSTLMLIAASKRGAFTANLPRDFAEKLPEVAFFTGASASRVATAHRARSIFEITVHGVQDIDSEALKAHNAIYMASEIITDVRMMNTHLAYDERMGKGFLVPTGIATRGDGVNMENECVITLERLYSKGETEAQALEALSDMASVKRVGAKVEAVCAEAACAEAACAEAVGAAEDGRDGEPRMRSRSSLEHVMSEDDPMFELMEAAEERYYGEVKRAWAVSDVNVDAMAASGVPVVTIGPDGASGAYDAAGMLAAALEALK